MFLQLRMLFLKLQMSHGVVNVLIQTSLALNVQLRCGKTDASFSLSQNMWSQIQKIGFLAMPTAWLWGWQCRSVLLPLCSRLKYLDNYHMNSHWLLYRHSWSQKMRLQRAHICGSELNTSTTIWWISMKYATGIKGPIRINFNDSLTDLFLEIDIFVLSFILLKYLSTIVVLLWHLYRHSWSPDDYL